jgi:hypothetical protein
MPLVGVGRIMVLTKREVENMVAKYKPKSCNPFFLLISIVLKFG